MIYVPLFGTTATRWCY